MGTIKQKLGKNGKDVSFEAQISKKGIRLSKTFKRSHDAQNWITKNQYEI